MTEAYVGDFIRTRSAGSEARLRPFAPTASPRRRSQL